MRTRFSNPRGIRRSERFGRLVAAAMSVGRDHALMSARPVTPHRVNAMRALAWMCLMLMATVVSDRKLRASAVEPTAASEAQDVDVRPSAPGIQTGTARIGGRVTDEGGRSLRQATVILRAASGATRSTATDADGHYEFTALAAGRYSLTASKATYLSLDYGQSHPRDVGQRLQLEDDQAEDAADFALPRGGVIAGRVVDEFGEPVPDARVVAMLKLTVAGRRRLLETGRTAVTNDVGEFRLAGLLPGPSYLAVFPAAPEVVSDRVPHAQAGYAATYFPGTADVLEAQPVAVGLSETVAIGDVTLKAVPLATVSGWAADESGDVRRTGSVIAVERGGSLVPLGASVSAPIRSDGTFEISGLAPAEYLLYTSADRSKSMLTATVRAAGADVTGVALRRLRDVTVSGRVVIATPNAAARPTMVRLMLLPVSQEAFLDSSRIDTSTLWVNEDFSFRFTAPATEIALQALPTNAQWAVRAIRLNGIDITDTGLDLRESGNVSDVEIELTSRPPTLSVGVTDETGRAPGRFTLLVFPEDQSRWFSTSSVLVASAPSIDARVVTRRLPPGRYLGVALTGEEASGALREPEFLESVRWRATSFSLSDGETEVLELKVDPRR